MRTMYRLLYRSFDTRVAAQLGVATARTVATVTGSDAAGWLSAFERRFVRSGWPGHGMNWVNLHASMFLTRMRRVYWGAPAPRPRRTLPARTPLRVGIIGRFSGLLGFPPALFVARPRHLHLTVFDVPYKGERAEWLRPLSDAYCAVDLDDDGPRTHRAARTVSEADLDVLVNVNWKRDAHHLLDLVETGCVSNYCVGSDLLHHPRVDIELVWQLQPDNEIRGGRMWCTNVNAPVGQAFIYQISGLYDQRDMPSTAPPAWHDREPLIVSHGSLYKFAVPEFTTCILDLLTDNPSVQWVLFGKDDGRSLARITESAGSRGLEARVHYRGAFSAVRGAHGEVTDPGWRAVQDVLSRARLAPDPFPIGSGSSRFEAYVLGAPCPHMGITPQNARLMSCELPVLAVPAATAHSVGEYRALSNRCLRDPATAERIQRDQITAARVACDPVRWWREIEAAYRAWQARAEAA